MLYPQYNDPLHIVWRKGDESDPYVDINQSHKIINNMVVLKEIPDEFNGVLIDSYSVIDEGTPTSDQFLVDYNYGILTFNPTENGKTVIVNYKGRGIISYPAERIYLHTEGESDIVQNLQQVIDYGESGINALALMDSKIAEVDTAVVNANTATNEANTARDSANTSASNADSKAVYAETQGSYALTQGDYAKVQGDYAKSEGDYAKDQGDHAKSSIANSVFLGDYVGATAYKANNTVRYNNALYRCIQDSQNNLPTNTAYWIQELSIETEVADAQRAATEANTARDNANTSASNADTKAAYAQTQGDYAKTQGDYASDKVIEINTKITEANTATTNANTARDDANTSASNADTKAAYAQTQGDYAKTQGDYAKLEGDYAQSQGDLAKNSIANYVFLGEYAGATVYKVNNTVRYNNTLYRCIQDSQNNLPTDSLYWIQQLSVATELADVQQATIDANIARDSAIASASNADTKATHAQTQGDFAQSQGNYALGVASEIRHLGDYKLSTSYVVNNSVSYNGSSYICIADCTGITPTNTSNWELLALKGYDGVGNVDSVNGYGGNVVLNATDVGAIDVAEKGTNSGVATLDSNGKIPLNQIPDISKQQTYIVANSTERSSLVGMITGDKSYETTTGDSYIYDGTSWNLWADADWANVNIDWGNIKNTPSTYAPSSHNHSVSEISNFDPATKADKDGTLQSNLNAEMVGGKRASDFTIASHSTNISNPHGVTISQIGAETPTGAQTKADTAEANAKSYTDSSVDNNVALRKDGDGFAIINGSTRTTLGTKSIDLSYTTSGTTGAIGNYSYTEGEDTTASGSHSSAKGYGTKATGEQQSVEGKYNIEDTRDEYAHIIGNGIDDANRGNAVAIDWNGNIFGGLERMKFAQVQVDPPIVEYRRQDDTLYLRKTASNPDGNGFYQTVAEEYFFSNGSALLKTITFTLTFNEDGTIATSDGGVEAYV